jgi:hypothetical protein
MIETIIAVGIVAVFAFLAGRSLYRTVTGKNEGCGCSGSCGSGACRDLAGIHQGRDGLKDENFRACVSSGSSARKRIDIL